MSGSEMGPIRWVLDDADLAELLDAINNANEVVFDTETTGLDEQATTGGRTNGGVAARVSMATLTLPQVGEEGDPTTWVLPLSHPYSPFYGNWRWVLRFVAVRIVHAMKPLTGQHIKFDCKWVQATTGIDISPRVFWDTMVSSHLLDETRSTSLKQRASETFGVERWDDVALDYPGASEFADIWKLGEYAARDTYWTWRLASKARYDMMLSHPEDAVEPEDIQLAKLGRVARLVAMPTIASLAAIEQRGFLIDQPWVRDRLASEEAIAKEALDRMAEQYGQDRGLATSAATATWFKEFTENAIEAGDLRITALTDTGNPQWNKHVLRRLALKGYPVAQMILDQRGASKKAEYLRSWLDHVAADGAIHTTYHSGRVVTGRLSSAEPNMQQVTKVLKPAFVPRPGNVIIDLDYAAIEMRVAAFISRCEPMLEAFQNGKDPHRIMAGTMTGKAPENVTKDERQGGKAGNFGLLFGMSAEGFLEYADDVYQVVMTMEEAVNAREAFFTTWKGIADWHAKVHRTVERQGYVTSPIGRVRHLPDVWSDNHALANYARRQAINSPVQGFASDLMQISAASIQGLLPGHEPVKGALLVGTVHDSIVAEAPENDWERVARECQARMTTEILPWLERLDCILDVPLAAEVTAGTRWGLADVGELL